MAIQTEPEADVGVSTLVSGIVQDARKLFMDQMKLFQVEIKSDIRRTLMAVIPVFAGMGLIVTALFLLGTGGVHLLVALVPELPLWGAYLGIGGTVAVVGIMLILWGKSQLASINPLPEQAIKGLKENLTWETKK